jgi:hypothetical protein
MQIADVEVDGARWKDTGHRGVALPNNGTHNSLVHTYDHIIAYHIIIIRITRPIDLSQRQLP